MTTTNLPTIIFFLCDICFIVCRFTNMLTIVLCCLSSPTKKSRVLFFLTQVTKETQTFGDHTGDWASNSSSFVLLDLLFSLSFVCRVQNLLNLPFKHYNSSVCWRIPFKIFSPPFSCMRAGLIKNSRMVCVELCIHVIFISRSLCTLHNCLCEKSHISSFSLH
jgi:hypothetical protein